MHNQWTQAAILEEAKNIINNSDGDAVKLTSKFSKAGDKGLYG